MGTEGGKISCCCRAHRVRLRVVGTEVTRSAMGRGRQTYPSKKEGLFHEGMLTGVLGIFVFLRSSVFVGGVVARDERKEAKAREGNKCIRGGGNCGKLRSSLT